MFEKILEITSTFRFMCTHIADNTCDISGDMEVRKASNSPGATRVNLIWSDKVYLSLVSASLGHAYHESGG